MENEYGVVNDIDNSYHQPLRMQGNSIIYLTNPKNVIDGLSLNLRNQIKNDDGKIISKGEPLLNEKGINSVLAHITSVVNQTNILGNISEKQIPNFMEYFSESLIRDLMVNRIKYGMTFDSRRKVCSICINLIYMVLNRITNEGDRRFFGKITMEQHTTVDTKKGNNGLFPWRNG